MVAVDVVLAILFALLGIAVGSFLNVCIDRLPAGKSLVYPPSHCDACRHPLSPWDLVPLASYLWLRGRCRYCGASIGWRSPFVELCTGLFFFVFYLRYGLSAEFAFTVFYFCIFWVILFIDLKHGLILNKVVYPAAAVAMVVLSVDFFLPELGIFGGRVFWPQPEILSGLVGGAVGFLFLLIPAVISPGGMGWGDVKMAGLIGLVTGFPLVIVAIFTGIVLGGLVAIVLVLLKIRGRKETIPFGPFLSLGAIAALLWGPEILNWYLSLF